MTKKTQNAEQAYYKAGDRITITLMDATAEALNAVRSSFLRAMEHEADMATNGWPADATVLRYAILRARHVAK